MLECGLTEAIKTDLLFGELELVAQRIAPHHLKKPCSVSLLDLMKHHLTGEAEVSALAHAVQMPVLRPHLEGMRQPALPDKLHEALPNLLGHPLKLPIEGWRP